MILLQEIKRSKRRSIIGQLQADPLRFAALAEQFSVCPSKKAGGSLGQIGKGQTVPEFEKQLMRLPVGLAETPIESRYGFHVVRLNNRLKKSGGLNVVTTTTCMKYSPRVGPRNRVIDWLEYAAPRENIKATQLRAAVIINYPKIAPGFCADSRRDKGRIAVLCNSCRNAEAAQKDKQDGVIY
ncbi:MAG: hypothetical protein GY927_11215, partial [bacterium]|nr:hypothetical protein [bacterium]